MGLARASLIGGPAKVYTGSGIAFWTPDTLSLRMEPSTNELAPSLFGRVGEATNDLVLKVSPFTPFGLWQNLTTLFPTYYTNPTMGARLFGDADVPWKIWSNDGALYTIRAGAVMKPPQLTLSADGPAFGPMELGGVVGTSLDPDDANSYYTIAGGASDPGGAFAITTYKQQLYTAAWGAITGFTSFQAQDKWTIDVTPKLEPVKVQGWTRDYKMTGMTISARCIPVGPTAAQIYAACEDSTEGGRLGEKGLADLTITGDDATTVITLKNMAIKNRGFAFGSVALRQGEIAFVNVVAFTAGVPGALMTLA